MSKVVNKILKQELVNWKNLKWFQPEKLKSTNQTITQKLKTSLIKNGFSMPFNVWQKGKDLWILDGHYRFSAMQAMESEGVEIPESLPANFINCKNETEAKKLVLVYNSHYANIVKDELVNFAIDFPQDEIMSEINLPSFSIEGAMKDSYEHLEYGMSPNVPSYNSGNGYVLNVVLSNDELIKWNELKEERKVKKDKMLFKELTGI